ncbi:hypothetical protein [Chitinophaga sp.]|uniref:hypothetical protein n=1 Tax=Chitinophaga sp. TaxID=1869181 RepID=UPI0031DBB841
MIINKNNFKVLATVLVLLTTAAAIAGIPSLVQHNEEIKELPVPEIAENDATEKAILNELYTVSHQLDSMTVYTIEGTILVKDLKDSSNNLECDYLYTRLGNNMYYRMGKSEIVSLQSCYLSVSHDTKELFLSAPKEVENPMSAPIDMQVKRMSKEGYQVTRAVKNGEVTITMSNPSHITMRDYSLTYDSTAWITKTDMRMADELYPADRNKDKLITFRVKKFEPLKAREELLKPTHYFRQQNGVPVPVAALKDYELINH